MTIFCLCLANLNRWVSFNTILVGSLEINFVIRNEYVVIIQKKQNNFLALSSYSQLNSSRYDNNGAADEKTEVRQMVLYQPTENIP